MQTEEIYSKLTSVMQDVFDDDTIIARPDLTADDVDGWDSVQHIRLIISIEAEFGIKFAASEVGEPKNVGELVDIISHKLAK